MAFLKEEEPNQSWKTKLLIPCTMEIEHLTSSRTGKKVVKGRTSKIINEEDNHSISEGADVGSSIRSTKWKSKKLAYGDGTREKQKTGRIPLLLYCCGVLLPLCCVCLTWQETYPGLGLKGFRSCLLWSLETLLSSDQHEQPRHEEVRSDHTAGFMDEKKFSFASSLEKELLVPCLEGEIKALNPWCHLKELQ